MPITVGGFLLAAGTFMLFFSLLEGHIKLKDLEIPMLSQRNRIKMRVFAFLFIISSLLTYSYKDNLPMSYQGNQANKNDYKTKLPSEKNDEKEAIVELNKNENNTTCIMDIYCHAPYCVYMNTNNGDEKVSAYTEGCKLQADAEKYEFLVYVVKNGLPGCKIRRTFTGKLNCAELN